MKFGDSLDATDTMYPATSSIVDVIAHGRGQEMIGASALKCPVGASVYGYVIAGSIGFDAVLAHAGVVFAVSAAEWNAARLGSTAKFWAVVRYGYKVPATFTIPEAKGRLSYIDGCTDSMLVYPARKGDGSLNLLQFPPNIKQTWHTHPSIRLGYVLSGKGMACHDLVGDRSEQTQLTAGTSFMLTPHATHRFMTGSEEMRIIAYHPDGDWGPEDENHPMLNRTYIK